MEYEETLLNLAKSNLFARMEACFPSELAQRYFELRGGILSNEHILESFYSFEDEIPELSFVKEYIRWGTGPMRKHTDLPGADYEQIEAYLQSVSERLDAKYTDLAQKAGQ